MDPAKRSESRFTSDDADLRATHRTPGGNTFLGNLKSEDEFAVVLLVGADIADKSFNASLHHQPADGMLSKQLLSCEAMAAARTPFLSFQVQGTASTLLTAAICLYSKDAPIQSQRSMPLTYRSPPAAAALAARVAAGLKASAARGSF